MALVTHINLKRKMREELALYLRQELDLAISARASLENDWDRWEMLYQGKPESESKDFPFPRAANLVVPLIGIHVDAMLARIFRLIFQYRDIAVAKAFVPELEQYMRPLQRFINWSVKHELDLEEEAIPTMISCFKLGNGFMTVPWVRQVESYKSYDSDGNTISVEEEMVHNGPKPQSKRVQDIIVPPSAVDIQTAAWVSERTYMSWGDLKRAERDGVMTDVDRVMDFQTEYPDDQLTDDYSDVVDAKRKFYEIHRVQVKYDVNGDGQEEDVVAIFERQSLAHDKFLAIYWHPYRHRRRDIVHFKLFPKAHKFYAAGIAEYLEDIQEEVTTIHRQRIDNATLANTRVWAARRGSNVKNIKQLWAGKVIPLDNPKEDLVPLQAGDVYQSSFNNESLTKSIAEERTGVTQQSLGKPPRRETATVGLAIVQESQMRFDFNAHLFRMALSELLMQVAELYQQFRPQTSYGVMGEDGALVQELFDFTGIGKLRRRMKFELVAASQNMNREIERQQTISLTQMMSGFFDRMFQMAIVLSNPQVPPEVKSYAAAVAKSSETFMEKVLNDFDIHDVKELLPRLNEVMGGQAAGAEGGASGGPEGGMGAMETDRQLEEILQRASATVEGLRKNGMGG